MNIVVTDFKGLSYHFRPDSTLVRDSTDFFLPPFLTSIKLLYGYGFRVERGAKSVKRQFVNRYIESFSEGILLYGEVKGVDKENIYLTSSTSFDRSSYLPKELKPLSTLERERESRVEIDGKLALSRRTPNSLREVMAERFEELSQRFSFKSGDLLFIEESLPIEVESIPCSVRLLIDQLPLLEFKIR